MKQTNLVSEKLSQDPITTCFNKENNRCLENESRCRRADWRLHRHLVQEATQQEEDMLRGGYVSVGSWFVRLS